MAEVNEVVASLEALIAALNRRLGSLRAWLMALTGLYAALLMATVALVLMLARR
jgi:hypothetical protein